MAVQVNTLKTKVVVFSKHGPIRLDKQWFYTNEPWKILKILIILVLALTTYVQLY